MLSIDLSSRLIEAARQASRQAYCPYSRFAVGAAALGGSGATYTACNVENASFGLTMCAERSAVARAVAEGETVIRAMAVYTPTPKPTAPCGACRQVMNEFGADLDLVCACDGPDVIRTTLGSLLPAAFGPHNLSGAGGPSMTEEWTAE